MDFRICPACKASVLEDDVQDCPFCGASMSGKPSAAKPAKATAPSKPVATASPGKPAGAPAAAAAPAAKRPSERTPQPQPETAGVEDGDPFEVDTRAAMAAAPLSPKPAQGRTYRVVCPMCETPGFMSIKHAGKDVKCCNPECLVPIFTAPKPAKPEKDEEPEPTRGMSMTVLAIATVVVLVGASTAGYFLVVKKGGKPSVETNTLPPSTLTQGDGAGSESETATSATPQRTGPPAVPLDQVRDTSLTELVKAAQQRDNNRSKPYGRSLAADAYARVGRFKEARDQLQQLQSLRGAAPFFQVEPLVAIAMEHRSAGDSVAAGKALDEALAAAQFPLEGRPSLDSAGILAAALAVAGRNADAGRVADANNDPGPRGHVSALWRGAIDLQTFDVDSSAGRPYLQNMPHPQWVAVTRSLFAWASLEAALAWAKAAPNAAARENSLAAWAGAVVERAASATDEAALQQVAAVAAELAATGQARVWSAVADAQLGRNDRTAAAASLQKAVEALATVEPPPPMPVPGMKAIYDSLGQPRAGLPDPTRWHAAALAALDVAQLQSALGNPAEAWSSVQKALGFVRATAPSPAATQALLDACEKSRASVERDLQQKAGIETNRMFRAFNDYRKQCGVLHGLAQDRQSFGVQMLRRAIHLGLGEQVWQEISAQQQQTDANAKEPWFETSLPGLILASAQATGRSELATAVTKIKEASPSPDTLDLVETQLPALVAAEEFGKAAGVLKAHYQRSRENRYPADLQVLRAVSRLLRSGHHEQAFRFAAVLPDQLVKEDAFWLIAAAAVRDGQHSSIWRLIPHEELSATEKAALYRGFIDGLATVKSGGEHAAAQTAAGGN